MGNSCRHSLDTSTHESIRIRKFESQSPRQPSEKDLQEQRISSLERQVANLQGKISLASKTSSKNLEVERKYLISLQDVNLKESYHPDVHIKQQGYIWTEDDAFSQVRISTRSDRDYGLITIKTTRDNDARWEYQYQIPFYDAVDLISRCKYRIDKKRQIVPYVHDGTTYHLVVDEFFGDNKGLYLAEIEFDSHAACQMFVPPEWCVKNVTNDDYFYNHNLAKHPFKTWNEQERKKLIV